MSNIKAYEPTNKPHDPEQLHPETDAIMQRIRAEIAASDELMAQRLADFHDKTHADLLKPRRKTRATTPTPPAG